MVGLLFLDTEVETSYARQCYDWLLDEEIKELLLENISPVVSGLSKDNNVEVFMDFNF